jgi:hypothetical protein
MRKFLIAAALGLALAAGLAPTPLPAQPVGPPNEVWCNRINNATSGATVGVSISPVTNRTISLCGFIASAGAASATFQLLGGQGATCGTQTVQITPVINLPANGTVVDHTSAAWVSLPALSNVCISITGTGPVSYQIYYTQF